MWPIVLFISLLLGQLGRIQITPTITFYVHDIVIVCYIIFHIPLFLKQRKTIRTLSLVKPILLVCLICIISLLANMYRFSQPEILVGIGYLVRFMLYSMLYVIVRIDKRPTSYWFGWIFWLGVCFALVGLLQLFVYPDLRNLSYDGWDPHYYRLFSTLFDPNFMGGILLMSFLSGLTFIDKRKQNIWVMSGLATIFVAFLLTYSRSSYVAAIVAFGAHMMLARKWKLSLWLLGFCVLLLYLPAIGGESTFLFRTFTALARITNWQEGMRYFYESPVIGFGFNMVKSLPHNAPTLQPGILSRSTSGYENSVVFVLVTTGAVGLSVFTVLWMKMVRIGTGIFNRLKNRRLGLLYIVALVAVFVHSMFLNTLFYPQMMIILWILTGAVEKEGK